MDVRLIKVDPNKSVTARIIYEYGNDKYSEGLYSGFIYASLGFIFLFCFRELLRVRKDV